MKNLKLSLFQAIMLLLLFINSTVSKAQGCDCPSTVAARGVDSIYVSTGIQYSWNSASSEWQYSVISDGASDPYWTVSDIQIDCSQANASPNLPSFPAPGVAATLSSILVGSTPLSSIWASNTSYSKWISYSDGNFISTEGDYSNCVYYTTYRRTFILCDEDNIQFDLQVFRDNWIHAFKIVNNTIGTYSESPTNNYHYYWDSTKHITGTTGTISANTSYAIEIVIGDTDFGASQPVDPSGIQVTGKIWTTSSAPNNKHLRPDAYPSGCP